MDIVSHISKFSTSDNFLMEINASNVAQHKMFRRKPSFVDKKMDETSSFGGLSIEEI